MRVLHINCNYIGTTLHQLMIEKLDDLGVENQVFVPTYDKRVAVIEPNANVCVCECFKKWDRIVFDYKQRKIQMALEKQIHVSEFDVIHAYTLFTDGNSARQLSKEYGIPYVVAIRNTDVNDFFRLMPHLRSRGVQIMRDAAAVFFLSDSYQRQVFEKYVPQKYQEEILDKTKVIPNGIDEFWFENKYEDAKYLDKNAVKLVYAGRIDKNKNIRTTQKAMKILRKQGIETTLTVVGKVQDQKEFKRIQEDVYTTCLPAMPKEELINVYRASDIFVMPSFTESFGLVYAEAMSQGLPVIYSKGQGFDGQFPDGTIGIAVDSRNPKSVADGIRTVIDNYAQITSNCPVASMRYNWESISRDYSSLYERIAEKHIVPVAQENGLNV